MKRWYNGFRAKLFQCSTKSIYRSYSSSKVWMEIRWELMILIDLLEALVAVHQVSFLFWISLPGKLVYLLLIGSHNSMMPIIMYWLLWIEWIEGEDMSVYVITFPNVTYSVLINISRQFRVVIPTSIAQQKQSSLRLVKFQVHAS